MTTNHRADVAIVGAGIVGLAHALAAAKRGYRVVVFERDPQAQGASIRNFGTVYPVGQAGNNRETGLQSRAIWLELAEQAGFWLNPVGTLIVAYAADELAVMDEFAQQMSTADIQMLTATETLQRSPALRAEGVQGGVFSATELVVDPREAIRALPAYLTQAYGVEFHFQTSVTAVDLPHLTAGGETWQVERVLVCGGIDFETLYPAVFRESGLTRCKLQMLRTDPQPAGFDFGPILATALTLKHYPAFATSPSLPALRERLNRQYPDYDKWGIHLLAAQNGRGELVLGDSHEYGLAQDPFDSEAINALIMRFFDRMLKLPAPAIAARWHGIYAKHKHRDYVLESPAPGVYGIAGLGGAGMTLSFGLAEQFFDKE